MVVRDRSVMITDALQRPATSDRAPARCGQQVVACSVTAAFSTGVLDHTGGLEVSQTPAARESHRYGAGEPAFQARRSSLNEVPPRAASNARLGVPALGVFLGALEHGDPQTAARFPRSPHWWRG